MKSQKKEMHKTANQLFLYLIVGGGAALVEWLLFYICTKYFDINYITATSLAFVFSTFANWVFGRLLLFKTSQNIGKELAKIYLTSITGLLMNILIMWVAIDGLGLDQMVSKVLATGIVFFWNFYVRKFIIYKS